MRIFSLYILSQFLIIQVFSSILVFLILIEISATITTTIFLFIFNFFYSILFLYFSLFSFYLFHPVLSFSLPFGFLLCSFRFLFSSLSFSPSLSTPAVLLIPCFYHQLFYTLLYIVFSSFSLLLCSLYFLPLLYHSFRFFLQLLFINFLVSS